MTSPAMTSDPSRQPPSGKKPAPRFQGANAGYLLFAGAIMGLGLGALVDQWRDASGHAGLLTGFGLGTAAGLYHMIREGMR